MLPLSPAHAAVHTRELVRHELEGPAGGADPAAGLSLRHLLDGPHVAGLGTAGLGYEDGLTVREFVEDQSVGIDSPDNVWVNQLFWRIWTN